VENFQAQTIKLSVNKEQQAIRQSDAKTKQRTRKKKKKKKKKKNLTFLCRQCKGDRKPYKDHNHSPLGMSKVSKSVSRTRVLISSVFQRTCFFEVMAEAPKEGASGGVKREREASSDEDVPLAVLLKRKMEAAAKSQPPAPAPAPPAAKKIEPKKKAAHIDDDDDDDVPLGKLSAKKTVTPKSEPKVRPRL
jgi:hypothetical protein